MASEGVQGNELNRSLAVAEHLSSANEHVQVHRIFMPPSRLCSAILIQTTTSMNVLRTLGRHLSQKIKSAVNLVIKILTSQSITLYVR